MERTWWRLPGPARFIDHVIQDFLDGRSCILSLPLHYPRGLREALADRILGNDVWNWRIIDLEDDDKCKKDPVTGLHDRLAPPSLPGSLLSVRSLSEAGGISGKIVWVGGLASDSWATWREFLEAYNHACRALPYEDRGLFCVPVIGPLNDRLPPEDVSLSIRRWSGYVDQLDVLLQLSQLIRNRISPPLHCRIAMAVAGELAGGDIELAEVLAHEDLDVLLSPRQVLSRFGETRGWNTENTILPEWQRGMVDHVEGRIVVHSSVLAMNGNDEEICRRIWRGQVGVLFAFIEEQRVRLLRELGNSLTVPFETQFGVITDVRDLEIPHILAQARRAGIPRHVRSLISHLRDMRHALAHLEPVKPQDLFSQEVFSCAEQFV